MDAVRDMSGHWPQGHVHFESFGASSASELAPAEAFDIKLKPSNQIIHVPAHQSILEALRQCGHFVPSSCESGTCGSCKTRFVSGDVEHHDFVLNLDEQRDHIMVCISRAKGLLELELAT